MAPSSKDEEPKFRFVVKIMPPRRPANSLLNRLQQPKVEEPLHIIAVPARASETFADVWRHIKERYERNYTVEEVGRGWFHKLQDRFGADIDSHDGVGELGYTTNSPREDLVLVMLQNEIDRDGSVPETSGLRPPGFSRPELSAEQEQQAKRRKIQEERYGAALEDVDEDMPIESRERSLGPDALAPGAQDDGDDVHKIDADGFAVPQLPGSVSRKRKRSHIARGNVIPSSIEGENEDDLLVQDSQTSIHNEGAHPETVPKESQTSRARIMRSVPADTGTGASTASPRSTRTRTTAPGHHGAGEDEEPPRVERLAALQASSSKPIARSKDAKPQPRSPPTPVSATSQPMTQQPPESAQRPKPTPPVPFTSINERTRLQPPMNQGAPEDDLDFDPIEDDDLLQGIAGTANDEHDAVETGPGAQAPAPVYKVPKSAPTQTGKLVRTHQFFESTPKSRVSATQVRAFTPAKNALKQLSASQGSTQKNPRSRLGSKDLWTPDEDAVLLRGFREGLNAAETSKKYNLEGRTPSAVRGRRALLIKQDPGIEDSIMDNAGNKDRSTPSATKRKSWSVSEKQTISRAIAEGFDAHEINAQYFPTRSLDSMLRIVLSLQDQAWKVAAMDSLFPNNGAQLPGWTPKDGCKLRRAYKTSLPLEVAKDTYFGRWSMADVQRQMDEYSAQIKALQTGQARASQAGSAIKKAVFGSSQLPLESSQMPVNSSPVERSMQARAARRLSVDAQQRPMAIDVPSSPPQASAAKALSTQASKEDQTTNQEQRLSSPIVDITANEQANARDEVPTANCSAGKPVSRPSSGNGRQLKLNFSRDKGKKRADGPRPSSQELDAQYSRRPNLSGINLSATQSRQRSVNEDLRDSNLVELYEIEEDDEHNPADDLEMLNAEFEHEKEYLHQEPQPPYNQCQNHETSAGEQAMARASFLEARRPSASTAMTMQSPITTSSNSSILRRRSRVEFGVDTRVAEQLSQELNRSLSREAREEAAHEEQVFHTPDPKIQRYRRSTKPATVTFSDDVTIQENEVANESQAFQTQDPATTRSQRASRVAMQSQYSPRGIDNDLDLAKERPALQPSPQIGISKPISPSAVTPGATPAKPGKLPSRGQSYASRIKDIHRPAQTVTTPSLKDLAQISQLDHEAGLVEHTSDSRSSFPTDTEICAEAWDQSAAANDLGLDREERYHDLKISAFTLRATGRGDWEEVKRLKAEEKRLHRQRKIAQGVHVSSERDTQHPDGPAQGGDIEEADEDVIRADDNSAVSSEVDEEYDDKIWDDADNEQPPDVEHDRHFSEVEDEGALDEVKEEAPHAIQTSQEPNRLRRPFYAADNEETTTTFKRTQDIPQTKDVDATESSAEHDDELELPTVQTLRDANGDVRHALTDDTLQELNNSGGEGSPTRLSQRKRNSIVARGSPTPKHKKQRLDDRAVMPPPKADAKVSKRQKRRKRHSDQHTSKSGSERSSSFSHHPPGSDAPQQHAPSTPVQPGPSAHPAKRANTARPSTSTPVKQTPQALRTQAQKATAGNLKLPAPAYKDSQYSNGGGMSGLSGLVHKAHIPTPPKVKQAPQKENKPRKLDIHADDDESAESSDSD